MSSLRAIATITETYIDFPGATIATSIFDNGAFGPRMSGSEQDTIGRALINDSYPERIPRHLMFKLIATLELGHGHDIPMKDVFAISVNDSIYVISELSQDPSVSTNRSRIHRIFGSIDKPGLTVLAYPREPQTRESRADEWDVIPHVPFDGRWEDNFGSTSLHLNFTGFGADAGTASHGDRFMATRIKEAVVSVHEAGVWVADLDLQHFLDENVQKGPLIALCDCKQQEDDHIPDEISQMLTSIENWSELLDPQQSGAVIRAHGNWEARLATSIVSCMRGQLTVVFDERKCWKCAATTLMKAHWGQWLSTVTASGWRASVASRYSCPNKALEDLKDSDFQHHPVYIM